MKTHTCLKITAAAVAVTSLFCLAQAAQAADINVAAGDNLQAAIDVAGLYPVGRILLGNRR